MPSLAFAAVAPDANHEGNAYDGHYYAVTTDGVTASWTDVENAVKDTSKVKDYVSNVTAPTHTEKGSVTLKCMKPLCDEEVTVEIAALDHDVDASCAERDFTLEAYAAKMLEQEEVGFKNAAQADTWVKGKKAANGCYVKDVKVCSCGYVKKAADSAVQTHSNTTHADKACPQCGETIKGVAHSVPAPNASIDVSNMVKVSEPTCGKGTGYEYQCSCGAKTVYYHTDVAADAHNYGTPVDVSVATTLTKDGKYAVKSGYVGVKLPTTEGNVRPYGSTPIINVTGFKFYKLNKVVTPAAGCNTAQTMGLECETCGTVLTGATENITVTHDWEKTHVAATCDHAGYNTYVCKACGVKGADAGKADEVIATEKELAHNYKVTKVPADCANQEYYVIECTTCDKKKIECNTADGTAHENYKVEIKNDTLESANYHVISTDTKTKKAYWTGLDNELKGSSVIDLTFDLTAAPQHKYGKKELLKAATCTSNEVWGYKCTECGKIASHTSLAYAPEVKANTKTAHNFVKNEVAATCGVAGYSYEQCSTCDGYKLGNTVSETLVEGCKTKIAPVVKTGAACTFDKWVVTKKPTVFTKGVESLVCSVCGADGHENEAIAKAKYAAPAVKAGKKSATVTVKATEGAVSYKISYKKAGGSYKTVAAQAGKKTIKKLAKGKKYTFKVIAVNAEGVEVASATKTVKVK